MGVVGVERELTERTEAEACGASRTLWQLPADPWRSIRKVSPFIPCRTTGRQWRMLVRREACDSMWRDAPLSTTVFGARSDDRTRHLELEAPCGFRSGGFRYETRD